MAPKRKQWGYEFTAVGIPIDEAARIVSCCTRSCGFSLTQQTDVAGGIHVSATQDAPSFQVIIHALPQRVSWHVRSEGESDSVFVRFDRRWFAWYRTLALSLAVAFGIFWTWGCFKFFRFLETGESLSPSTIVLPALGATLLFCVAALLFNDGKGQAFRILEDVRDAFRSYGSTLDEKFHERRDRKMIVAPAFLIYVVVTSLLGMFLADLRLSRTISSTQITLLTVAIVLGVIGFLGVRALRLCTRKQGADERFAPLVPSMMLMMPIMFVLLSQMTFHLFGTTDQDFWDSAFWARRLLGEDADAPILVGVDDLARNRAAYGLALLQVVIVFLLTIVVGLWCLAVLFVLKGLEGALRATRICARLHLDPETNAVKTATSGAPFLSRFRRIFLTVWILFTLLMVTGTIPLLCTGWGALTNLQMPTTVQEPVGTVIGTAYVIAFLAGLDDISSIPLLLSMFLWLGVAMIIVAVPLFSVGYYLRLRGRCRRRLMSLSNVRTAVGEEQLILGIVAKLAARANEPIPRVAVVPTQRLFAIAHRFGIRSETRILEVSSQCEQALRTEELEALLAHELAHFARGHCRRHNMMQFFGRLTLVGGAFATTLEDSFGIELEADREAVMRYGVRPDALVAAIIKLGSIGAVRNAAAPLVPLEGIAAVASLESGRRGLTPAEEAPWARRVAAGFRVWWRFFTSETTVSYWHPSLPDRLARLADWDNKNT